ncbi:hypothetical protein PTKU46_74990 [Paraburkholderia terrae]|uniref:flagellar motor switch protein FliN n=1 Tax=Paraburkholderia terrae TaxID=311230 RepID=UPI0030E17B56
MTLHTVSVPPIVKSLELPEQVLSEAASKGSAVGLDALELVGDINVTLDIRLGCAAMTINELMALQDGSVVKLDRLIGEPIDVQLNDRTIAHAEIVAVGETFGIRITDVLADR